MQETNEKRTEAVRSMREAGTEAMDAAEPMLMTYLAGFEAGYESGRKENTEGEPAA